jgi:hypothetical protein
MTLSGAQDARSFRPARSRAANSSSELNIHRSYIFLEMRDLRSARNGKHNRAALQNLGESNLARSGIVGLCDRIEDRARLGEATCRKREPGDEADPVLFAIIQHIFTSAID